MERGDGNRPDLQTNQTSHDRDTNRPDSLGVDSTVVNPSGTQQVNRQMSQERRKRKQF